MKHLNLYYYLSELKNILYDKGYLSHITYDVPIISIGNLTTGGTGKTPIVLETIREIKKIKPQARILVISKSYKTSLKHPAEITADKVHDAALYGDEPCLIKKKSDVYVWSGPIKNKTLTTALEHYKNNKINIDAVLVDDGFSHRKINRDLNVVLVDVSRDLEHYSLLPFGHLREDLKHIDRADFVFLTKINQADQKTLEFFRDYLMRENIAFGEVVFKSEIDLKKNDLYIFSGVANPLELEKNLKSSGFVVRKHKVFKDHHIYTDDEQTAIYKDWKNHVDSALCTTEKDIVKITSDELKKNVQVIKLNLEITKQDKDKYSEKISQIL
ncbi:MAG: tetraacyldisaccharide 4'-kinase [Pseudobdellovibrio sp.]